MTTQSRDLVHRIARDLYATYCASSGGRNFRGEPCPQWDDLTEAVRGHWVVVAKRVLSPASLTDYEILHPSGEVRSLSPGPDVLGHLPDPDSALATWRTYTRAE